VTYRWLSTLGKEVIVVPIGEPVEYNAGNKDTELVECLVLHSEHDLSTGGDVRKFAVANLKKWPL
jgi:hypothetical protein